MEKRVLKLREEMVRLNLEAVLIEDSKKMYYDLSSQYEKIVKSLKCVVK